MATVTQTARKQFNAISDATEKKLQERIDDLPETVEFRYVQARTERMPVPNSHPDAIPEFAMQTPFNSAVGLTPRDRIMDTFLTADGKEVKRPVDIAVIAGWDDNDNPIFAQRILPRTAFGRVFLNKNDPDDYEWLRFWLLSNYNKANENRDPSVEPEVELVDVVAESKARARKLNVKGEALVVAAKMSDDDMRSIALAQGWEETDLEVLRARLLEIADNNPEGLIQMHQDGERDFKATYTKAIRQGVITHNPESHELAWATTGEVFATLSPAAGKLVADQYAQWATTHKDGTATHNNIKNELSKKRGKKG